MYHHDTFSGNSCSLIQLAVMAIRNIILLVNFYETCSLKLVSYCHLNLQLLYPINFLFLSFVSSFNQIILEDLQWLLMSPFVAMVIILLVNHGFPAKDLLPSTYQSKTR